MRKIILIVAMCATGCAGTSTAQRPGRTVDLGTPIVSRGPSISSRLNYARQRGQAQLSKSEVTGHVVR